MQSTNQNQKQINLDENKTFNFPSPLINFSNILNNKPSIENLPDHLIQNEIFSYLTTKDLFFFCRAVCTNWHELIKNVWSAKVKEEMMEQVKSIDFVYEKEVLTKTYEFKLSYLINYKNLLTAYNNNANILTIIYHLVTHLNDEEVKNLVILFFSFLNIQSILELINSNNLEEAKNWLISDDNYVFFKIKFLELMIIEENLKEMDYLTEFKGKFNLLNKDLIENYNDFAKLIYSFLQGLIEYQILKVEVKELKGKIENLLCKLHEASKLWPKKKRFLEKAYKLIIFNKNSTTQIRKVLLKFEEFKIRHPLIDYNDECIALIIDLKKQLINNRLSEEDIKKNLELLDRDGTATNFIDEQIFENLCNRRILLTKKLIIVERFVEYFNKYICKDDKNENKFKIKNEIFGLREFLWCLKISANLQEEGVDENMILKTKKVLDENFNYETRIIKENQTMRNDNLRSQIDPNNISNGVEISQDDKDLIIQNLCKELDKYDFLVRIGDEIIARTEIKSNEDINNYCSDCTNKSVLNNKLELGNSNMEQTKNIHVETTSNKQRDLFSETNHLPLINKNNEISNDQNNIIKNNSYKPPAYGEHNIRRNLYNNQNANNINNTEISSNLINLNNDHNCQNHYSNSNSMNPNTEIFEEVKQSENINRYTNSLMGPSQQDLIHILESKEAEVTKLKLEKDKLVIRKQKIEQILDMLKKFIKFKDNMASNKKYYRAIIYLMESVKNSENGNSETENLLQLINSGELEEVINDENIIVSREENEEDILAFQQIDDLMRIIETDLYKQVNDVFCQKENKNEVMEDSNAN